MKKSKFLLVLTVLTYIFLIGPMFVMIGTAFNSESALAFPPAGFSFQWFEKAFSSASFIEGFKTSSIVSLAGTLLAMLLGVPAAYAMNKYRFPLKGLVNGFFISPTLIPAVVLGFSLLKSFVPSMGGSIYSGLLVGYTLIAIPYVIRVTSSALANFDFAVEEAARSLGCCAPKAFFKAVVLDLHRRLSWLLSIPLMMYASVFSYPARAR